MDLLLTHVGCALVVGCRSVVAVKREEVTVEGARGGTEARDES